MRTFTEHQDLSLRTFGAAADRGLMYQDTEDRIMNGRTLLMGGRELVNFGSCSYLGLETDPRLKAGAIDAVERFGTQFSCSRVYLTTSDYVELEALFEEIFGMPALVAPTTTLAHISAMPNLIGERDAVILDQQVHNSVHTAVNLVRAHGVPAEVVRHNDVEALETLVRQLRGKHRKVWYLADGLYSMFGDYTPARDLLRLMDTYENFHVYVDDAHSMSWCGERGKGYILNEIPHHPQMVVATSLAKGFGVGGGVLLVPDAEARRKVRILGGGLVFSGPIQPPVVGAAIASARIHLGPELPQLQAELAERIAAFNRLAAEAGLPAVGARSPIQFVGAGLPAVALNLVERLRAEGHYTGVATFPAVPMKRAGVRLCITRHHRLEDLERLVEAFSRHLPLALSDEGRSLDDVFEAFDGIVTRPAVAQEALEAIVPMVLTVRPERGALDVTRATTIDALDPEEWDRLVGDRGTFDANGLRFLERAFQGHERPEDNWGFHYFVVRDGDGVPVLATFFTEALWKDDMIASEDVSAQVEEKRRTDPYYLTSRNLGMGSLLTEGDHLYLDRSRDWRGALSLLLAEVADLQKRLGAPSIVLRDLPPDDTELDAFLTEQGYARSPMLNSMVIDVDWTTEAERLSRVSKKARYHQRTEALAWEAAYDVVVYRCGEDRPTDAELDRAYELYQQVHARGLTLNTFPLPRTFFRTMVDCPGWEMRFFHLKAEFGGEPGGPAVAFAADYRNGPLFVPLVVGLDYRYVKSHGAYRQFLLRTVRRAKEVGAARIPFGFSAELEKRRFGARPVASSLYVQASDHYAMDVMAQMMASGARSKP